MIADLNPYNEYKESAAPWFGVVPSHWEVKRLGSVFAERSETNEKYEVEEVLSVLKNIGVIPYSEKGRIGNKKSDDIGRYKIVRPDDIVVNCMNVIIGSVGRSRYTGCLSPVYYVLKRRQLGNSPRYLELVFQHKQFQLSLVRIGNGILAHRMRIPMEKLKAELFPLPPPEEQAAIVRFLDWANGRLERAIRAKRKVIALLNEQKQAIIHQAVTRGLDPNVPLKPSGIPWLGEIPEHWAAMPLKGVCKIQSGITLGKDYSGHAVTAYPYLRVANVQAGHVNLSVVKTIRVTKPEADRCLLQNGDVLMTEGGDLDKLGRGCVWDAQVSPCLHQNHVFAVRPNRTRLEPRFLSAILTTSYARAYFQSTAKQTTNLAATNKTKLGMFRVLLPHVLEQRLILKSLEEELHPVIVVTGRLEREIELLREYRTRLVADVVTGKLDVREAAGRLPDEEGLELSDDDIELDDEAETVDEEAVL
ncbi:MAG: restriction endonuclease subunit S [Planctomycetaceae bacterium]|nr:MAG: restriction endonuclease subunit S [Planctomycetaceae bacterium]